MHYEHVESFGYIHFDSNLTYWAHMTNFTIIVINPNMFRCVFKSINIPYNIN
jgi:hypothetical protein